MRILVLSFWFRMILITVLSQISSLRQLISCVASHKTRFLFSQDVTQAYPQSKTRLARPIYIKPPSVLKTTEELILRLKRSLHGVPEAGVHWFYTNHAHHNSNLHLTAAMPSVHPKVLSFSNSCIWHRSTTCLHTNDSLTICDAEFAKME